MRRPGDSGDDSSGERMLRSKKSDGPIIAMDAVRVGHREGAVRALHWISIARTLYRIMERINRSCADFVVVSPGNSQGTGWIEHDRDALNAPVISRRRVGASAPDGLRVLTGLTCRVLGVFAKRNAPPRILVDGGDGPTRLTLADSRSESDLSLLQRTLEMVTLEPVDIEVDGIELGRIDGAFIGTVMLLYGHQSRAGRGFRMFSVIPKVRRVFRMHCAEFLLDGLDRSR
jgi:hypothetical protein